MTKYDENYARINQEVNAMGDVIRSLPPVPAFDDIQAEDAAVLQTPLSDAFEVWVDAFITGKKSVEKDWDAYVNEMKTLRIDEFCKIYNDNLKK
jgi:putative aldouronate transport system substrate-binding protein